MGSDDKTKKMFVSDVRRHRSLFALNARFGQEGALTSPGAKQFKSLRYGTHLELDCPRHGLAHRVVLPFLNPQDGEPPVPNRPRYYYRTGSSLEDLTLERAGRDDGIVEVEGCWRGYVLEGEVIDAFGLGW